MKFSPICTDLFTTECGKVFLHGVTELNPTLNSNGYLIIRYRRGGVLKRFIAHRLIASSWCEGYSPDLAVNHKDGNKLNNAASNLEWLTWADNTRHAYATGLNNQSGENHSRVKLTAENVGSIREMLSSGVSTMAIAKKFKIGQRQIYYIKHGKSWAQQ